MRILMVHPGPNFSVADVHDGWAEALRGLGCQVASYNTDDRIQFYSNALIDMHQADETGHPIVRQAMTHDQAILAAMQGISHAVLSMWPDVVMFVSGFWVTPGMMELIRSRRMKVVLLATESPYQEDEQLHRAQATDITLLNDPVNLDRYRELGVTAEYMPHAYRPDRHYPRTGPLNPELNADLAFIGTGFASRIKFFEAMNLDGLDILLGGAWPSLQPGGDNADSPLVKYLAHDPEVCVSNEETAGVYRHAKCGINFYRREYSEPAPAVQPYAMGPREVEMAACELFFLRDPRPEGDEVLRMLPRFFDPREASDQLRWYLDHPDHRADAARQARAAIADRTFDHNARRLLGLLENSN